ncbi:hypothetical protein BSLG_010776 [Batrachochytrium salamandrivorans]|nr:hypothetical protein BSLG_010776 [Batrachochytrium salamandrivorans]
MFVPALTHPSSRPRPLLSQYLCGAAPSPSSEEDDAKTATDFISTRLNLGENDFKVVNSYTDSFGIGHVAALAKRDLAVSAPNATLSFEQASDIASPNWVSRLLWKLNPHSIPAARRPLTRWVQVWCSTTTGKAIQVSDFDNKASYTAIGLPRRDPTDGFIGLFRRSTEKPTRRRWTNGKATRFNSKEDPGTAANIAAAAVNLFYITNMVHDISAWYGLLKVLETSKEQLRNGGKDSDAIIINVLNPSNTNGADFFTPTDGQPGVMNMYRYTRPTPNRNPGLDNTIVLHECAHGISNRLTGGLTLAGVSTQLRHKAWSSDTATTGIVTGTYVTNRPAGSRSHPYTTNMKVNPLKYSDLRTRIKVHAIGEVWAIMLWEVYWNLVTSTDLRKIWCQQVRDLQGFSSVASALGPPTPAQMTFRFHLNPWPRPVIAVPMVDNVYKRSVDSLDPSSTGVPILFPESVYESIPYVAAAHVKNGEVAFFSSSFGTEQHLAKRDLAVSAPNATLSFEQASDIASTQLGIPVYSEVEPTLEYVAQSDGKVVYTYKFQLRDDPLTRWVQVWCDTTTGKAIQVSDFSNKASYEVIDFSS